MRAYLSLLRTLLERQLAAWRLAPWLVYLLAPVLFTLLGLLLLERTDYAAYGIALSGLWLVGELSGAARNDFLRLTFRGARYRRLRLLENLLLLLPFALLVATAGNWPLVAGMIAVAAALSRYVRYPTNFGAVPTPFSYQPFEYAIGVRRYWWLVAVAVFLLAQAIRVGNPELGLAAYGLTWLTGWQFYATPEPTHFVWIHALSPRDFLRRKLALGGAHQLLLALPFALPLLVVFPDWWRVLVVLTLLGLGLLALIICLKYTAYPERTSVGQALIVALALLVPPTILVSLPLYYQRAVARLHLQLA